jgi:hypothetical protein
LISQSRGLGDVYKRQQQEFYAALATARANDDPLAGLPTEKPKGESAVIAADLYSGIRIAGSAQLEAAEKIDIAGSFLFSNSIPLLMTGVKNLSDTLKDTLPEMEANWAAGNLDLDGFARVLEAVSMTVLSPLVEGAGAAFNIFKRSTGQAPELSSATPASNGLAQLTFSKLTPAQKDAFLKAQTQAEGANKEGTLPNRMNNPGAIMAGKFTAQFGGVAGDKNKVGTFAQFPTLEKGQQAQRALWESESYRDMPLDKALAKWVNPSVSTGYDNYMSSVYKAISSNGPVPTPIPTPSKSEEKSVKKEEVNVQNPADGNSKQGPREQVNRTNESIKVSLNDTLTKQRALLTKVESTRTELSAL